MSNLHFKIKKKKKSDAFLTELILVGHVLVDTGKERGRRRKACDRTSRNGTGITVGARLNV